MALRAALIAFLLLLLLLPGGAAAAWQPPVTISIPRTFVSDVQAAYAGDGTPVVSWGWQEGLGNGARVGASMAIGSFAAERRLPSLAVGAPVLYGRSAAAVLTQRVSFAGGEERGELAVAFGGLRRKFRAPEAVARGGRLVDARLVGTARGDLALAWWEDRGTNGDRVWVATRPAGGRFGAPAPLFRGRVRHSTVAIGADGDVVVAWSEPTGVWTSSRLWPLRDFTGPQRLRSGLRVYGELHAVVKSAGRAAIAWRTAPVGEPPPSPQGATVEAVTRRSGASRFGALQRVDAFGDVPASAGLALVLDRSGRPALAWTTAGAIRFAVAGPGLRFGAPGGPPSADAELTGSAAGDDGRLLLLWHTAGFPDDDAVLASFDGAPPETAVPGAYQATAAFSPAGGAPLVAAAARTGRREQSVLVTTSS